MSLCTDLCPAGRQRFMPRHFFYMAYTGHLLVLLILEKLW
jgi:heterodisulfide reductase subunit C